MKTKISLLVLTAILPLLGFSQARISFVDDIYYTKGDKKSNVERRRDINNVPKNDTVYFISEKRDSLGKIESYEEGYYVNKFKESESDYEYSERINRFHTPQATDSTYYPNENNWDVPYNGYYSSTWSNPYWYDYNYSPYGYGYNPYRYG